MKIRFNLSRTVPFWISVGMFSGAMAIGGCASDGENKGGKRSADLSVKLRRIEVQSATFEEMDLRVIVVVKNASDKAVQLKGGTLGIMLKGKGEEVVDEEESSEKPDGPSRMPKNEAVPEPMDDFDESAIITGERYEGKSPSGVLPARSDTEIPMKVVLPLPEDPAALQIILDWHLLDIAVEGDVQLGGQIETFAGSRQVAAPTLPNVVMEEAQVASVDGGRQGAAFFTIGIDNPNSFEVQVDSFAWGVQIGEVQMTKPDKPSPEIVPPASVASFEDTIQVNQQTYGPAVRTLLRQNRVPYIVTGYIEVKGIRHPLRFVGEMEFAR